MLRLGLVINPIAGIGGPLALKGSDGVVRKALAQGGKCLANLRAGVTLEQLHPFSKQIQWFTAPGSMGAECLYQHGFESVIVGQLARDQTTAQDTEDFAKALVASSVDLLLFVGGDGTARNIVNAVGSHQLVLGIPAGVKMHSACYAISPQAAARVIAEFMNPMPVSASLQEVRDIDENALRNGLINASYYGDLLVPNNQRYVQQVKNSGELNDDEMKAEIAAGVVDDMDMETLYLVGAGTTPQAIMNELGLENTLLGVDVVFGRQLLMKDATALQLLSLMDRYPNHPKKIILTPTGNQGHIFGRGNQQISVSLLKKVSRENLLVVITPAKLAQINNRPLLIDSGDAELDKAWSFWLPIIIGYRQVAMYPLACGQD